MTNYDYIVYSHINKANGKRYIGLTSQTLKARSEKNGIGYRECPIFYNAIQKYGWDNFEHKILFENLTKEEAEQKEIELIAQYKSNQREFGYNISLGGNSSGKMAQETKDKISKTLKGREFSKEHREKIGKAQLGKKNHQFGKRQNLETIEKRRKWNLEHLSLQNCRKVKQLDKEGNLIKIWDSVGQVSRAFNVNRWQIYACCNGKQKTSRGYIWQFCV